MLFCRHCRKQVVVYGVSLGAAEDDELAAFQAQMELEGLLVVFNPPPFEPLHCPACGTLLVEEEP